MTLNRWILAGVLALLLGSPALGQRWYPQRQDWDHRQERDRPDWHRSDWRPPQHDLQPWSRPSTFQQPWDSRHVWVYPNYNGGTFTQGADGWWTEANALASFRYQEVGRTAEYVDLYDPDRLLYVRLYPNVYFSRIANVGDWTRGADGHWQ